MDIFFHARSNDYLIYPYFRYCHSSLLSAMAGLLLLSGCNTWDSDLSCFETLLQGDIQHVAQTREQRFLGKVAEKRAHCLGGDRAVTLNQSSLAGLAKFLGYR
jgi:hypothetical protein